MNFCCLGEYLLILCLQFFYFESKSVSINKNGYTGIVVQISENVNEDLDIIEKLKSGFEDASKLLYKATRKQTYFKDVTVVIPKTWSPNAQYGTVAPGFVENADFILNNPSSGRQNPPYTHGMMGCGQGGQYIHLTSSLVQSSESLGFGPLAKILVHEWAHYRWGVFDEYPVTGLNTLGAVDKFYMDEGTWKPIRCSEQIDGDVLQDCDDWQTECVVGNTGKPHPFCNFCIQLPNRAKGSLMSYQWVDSIEEFCDTGSNATDLNRHNDKAPSEQNKMCDGKSVWEVLRQHKDFAGSPGPENQATLPVINVVQETSEKVVMLLDVSGSMGTEVEGASRLQRLMDVVSVFILDIVPTGSDVAIVTFSNTANTHLTMTTITEYTRKEIVRNLTLASSGRTGIGLAFLEGLNILTSNGPIIAGSKIILVTDGEENVQPLISDVKDQVIDSGVIVHSLAMGNEADEQISAVSKQSGGKSFYYSESMNSSVLQDIFIESLSGRDSPIVLESTSVNIAAASSASGAFIVDSTVGKGTLALLFVNKPQNATLSVTAPDGNVYTGTNILDGFTASSTLTGIRFPTEIPAGVYQYRCSSDVQTKGTILVKSTERPNAASFSVKTWIQNDQLVYGSDSVPCICTLVTRNNNHVIGVGVKAFLENEDADNYEISLKDNGIGFDSRPNDGVYCAAILPQYISRNGRINIKVFVSNVGGNAKEVTLISNGAVSANSRLQENVLQANDIEIFQRVNQGGEIVVTGYTPTTLKDSIAPAKINTLSLVSVDYKKKTATVSWTAVGDDIDTGTASGYYILLGTDISELRTDISHGNSLPSMKPKAAGDEEVAFISIPDQNKTFFLCVRAVDESNNVGQCSNILPLTTTINPKWFPLERKKIFANDDDIVVIIVASCISFAFLMGILILFLCMACRREKRDNVLPIMKTSVALSASRLNKRYLLKGDNARFSNTSVLNKSDNSHQEHNYSSSRRDKNQGPEYYKYDGTYELPVVFPDYPYY